MKLLFSSVSPQLSWIQIQSQPARQAVQYNNHTSQVIIKHHFTSPANHPPNKQTKAVAVTVQFLLSFASNTIYYYFHNSNQYPSLCTTRSNLHSIVSSPHTLLPNWSCTKCLTIDETTPILTLNCDSRTNAGMNGFADCWTEEHFVTMTIRLASISSTSPPIFHWRIKMSKLHLIKIGQT